MFLFYWETLLIREAHLFSIYNKKIYAELNGNNVIAILLIVRREMAIFRTLPSTSKWPWNDTAEHSPFSSARDFDLSWATAPLFIIGGHSF